MPVPGRLRHFQFGLGGMLGEQGDRAAVPVPAGEVHLRVSAHGIAGQHAIDPVHRFEQFLPRDLADLPEAVQKLGPGRGGHREAIEHLAFQRGLERPELAHFQKSNVLKAIEKSGAGLFREAVPDVIQVSPCDRRGAHRIRARCIAHHWEVAKPGGKFHGLPFPLCASGAGSH